MLALGFVTVVVVVIFWPFWAREVPIGLASVSKLILDFARRHPYVSRILHVALEAVPDLAFVLLALAGLSYLMPELMHRFETRRSLRLSAFVVFMLFGLAAVIMNSVSREDQENQSRIDRNKMDALRGQVHDTLQFLVQSKGRPTELERRKNILDTLRSEYILIHPEASAAMIEGNANPAPEWMNKRLQELGEQWPYVPSPTPTVEPMPRSYVIWVDIPRFAGGEHEGDPMAVAHPIGFNVYFKQSGPNQVEIERMVNRLYIKSDTSKGTQKSVIEDFMSRVKLVNVPIEPETLMPNENPHFFSAIARDDTGTTFRAATQHDLENLRDGKEFTFVLALVAYKDLTNDPKKEHHLPLCVYLQAPANPPGIWGYCEGFNRSD